MMTRRAPEVEADDAAALRAFDAAESPAETVARLRRIAGEALKADRGDRDPAALDQLREALEKIARG